MKNDALSEIDAILNTPDIQKPTSNSANNNALSEIDKILKPKQGFFSRVGDDLSNVGKAWDSGNFYSKGGWNDIAKNIMSGGTPEDREKLFQNYLNWEKQNPSVENKSWVGDVVNGVANLIPLSMDMLPEAAMVGAATGAAGAAGGSVVPGVGTLAGGVGGFKAGATASMIEQSYKVGVADIYTTLRKDGVGDEMAAQWATWAAIPYGALEYAGKAIAPISRQFLGGKKFIDMINKITDDKLKNKILNIAAKKVADVAFTGTGESAIEGAQAGVTEFARQGAKGESFDGGKVANAAWQEAKSAAPAMYGMAALGIPLESIGKAYAPKVTTADLEKVKAAIAQQKAEETAKAQEAKASETLKPQTVPLGVKLGAEFIGEDGKKYRNVDNIAMPVAQSPQTNSEAGNLEDDVASDEVYTPKPEQPAQASAQATTQPTNPNTKPLSATEAAYRFMDNLRQDPTNIPQGNIDRKFLVELAQRNQNEQAKAAKIAELQKREAELDALAEAELAKQQFEAAKQKTKQKISSQKKRLSFAEKELQRERIEFKKVFDSIPDEDIAGKLEALSSVEMDVLDDSQLEYAIEHGAQWAEDEYTKRINENTLKESISGTPLLKALEENGYRIPTAKAVKNMTGVLKGEISDLWQSATQNQKQRFFQAKYRSIDDLAHTLNSDYGFNYEGEADFLADLADNLSGRKETRGRYSLDEDTKTEPSATVKRVIKAVETSKKQMYKNARHKPNVEVVEDIEGLNRATGMLHPKSAQAFSYGENLYIVANKMKSPKYAVSQMLHEYVGHYEIRGLLGSDFKPFMAYITKKYKGTSEWNKLENDYATIGADDAEIAEEMIAHLAEFKQLSDPSMWNRLVNRVQRALKADGMGEAYANLLNEDILKSAVRASRQWTKGDLMVNNNGVWETIANQRMAKDIPDEDNGEGHHSLQRLLREEMLYENKEKVRLLRESHLYPDASVRPNEPSLIQGSEYSRPSQEKYSKKLEGLMDTADVQFDGNKDKVVYTLRGMDVDVKEDARKDSQYLEVNLDNGEKIYVRVADHAPRTRVDVSIEKNWKAGTRFIYDQVVRNNWGTSDNPYWQGDAKQRYSLGESPSQEERDALKRQYKETKDKYFGTPMWLKAPNGKESNLTKKQWVWVRTPNFKKWFGDWENDPENASKVVDENGEPKVVYHGSPSFFQSESNDLPFTVFSLGGKNHRELFPSDAFFFSPEEYQADSYGANTGAFFLNSKNILNLTQTNYLIDVFDKSQNFIEEYAKENGIDYDKNKAREALLEDGIIQYLYDEKGLEKAVQNEIIKYAKKNNFDGISLLDDDRGDVYASVAVFNSEQIKSATDNIGTFDGKNPDIRYSIKPSNSQNFKGELQDYIDGKLDNRHVFKLGTTPEAMRLAGASDLPIELTASVLSTKEAKHNLNLESLKSLPEELADPIAIFQSAQIPNGLLVITEISDADGNRISVAVHLDKTRGRNRINDIRSIHGRSDFNLQTQVDLGLLRYINTKRKPHSLRLNRVAPVSGSVNKASLIKTYFTQDDLSQEEKDNIFEFRGENKRFSYSINRKINNIQFSIGDSPAERDALNKKFRELYDKYKGGDVEITTEDRDIWAWNLQGDDGALIKSADVPFKIYDIDEAYKFARENLQGKQFRSKDGKYLATLERTGTDKMNSGLARGKTNNNRLHALALANVGRIFGNSELLETTPDKNGDPNVKAVHKFYAPLYMDGQLYAVKITAKEFNENTGNRLYSIEGIDVNRESEYRGQSRGSKENSIPADYSDSVNNFIGKLRDVNKKIDKQAHEAAKQKAYEEAVELVAEEARRKGYDVKVYHGMGANGFNVADASGKYRHLGEGQAAHGMGLYVAESKDTAEGYRDVAQKEERFDITRNDKPFDLQKELGISEDKVIFAEKAIDQILYKTTICMRTQKV